MNSQRYFYKAYQRCHGQLYAVYSALDFQYIGPFVHDTVKKQFIMYDPFDNSSDGIWHQLIVLNEQHVKIIDERMQDAVLTKKGKQSNVS